MVGKCSGVGVFNEVELLTKNSNFCAITLKSLNKSYVIIDISKGKCLCQIYKLTISFLYQNNYFHFLTEKGDLEYMYTCIHGFMY